MIKLSDIQFPVFYDFRTPKGGAPRSIELHIRPDPEFVRVFGERVRASGGDYSHCRGYANVRFVHVGMERGLAFACELVDDIVEMFGQRRYLRGGETMAGRTVAILRGVDISRGLASKDFVAEMDGTTSIVDVLQRYACATEARAVEHGWTVEPAPETTEEAARRETRERAQAAVDALAELGFAGAVQGTCVLVHPHALMELIEAAKAARKESDR